MDLGGALGGHLGSCRRHVVYVEQLRDATMPKSAKMSQDSAQAPIRDKIARLCAEKACVDTQ